MSGYDDLYATAEKIREKAVEKFLAEECDVFKVDGRWQQFAVDETEEDISRIVMSAEMEFAEVPSMFGEFAGMSDPADYDDAINAMKQVMTALSVGDDGLEDPIAGDLYPFNTDLKDMTSAAGYLEEWDGLAVLEFQENYVAKFFERTLNQFAAACVLANALRAEQALWREARANVGALADEVEASMEIDKSIDWSLPLTVASAVTTVGLSIASGGATSVALTAVGAATDIAADHAPQKPVKGKSAREIIDDTRGALDELKAKITEAEQKVDDACSNANGTLTGSQAGDYITPEAPALTRPDADVGRPDSD